MLIVSYYIFKEVAANPRKYLPAEQAEQLEHLLGLQKFCSLMEDLIFQLCQDELSSNSVLDKIFSIMGKSSTQSGPSVQAILTVQNFLKEMSHFGNSLQQIFRPLQENDVEFEVENKSKYVIYVGQYVLPWIHFLSDLQNLQIPELIKSLQKQRSEGFLAYIEQREQLDDLAKNYLNIRQMLGLASILHENYSPKEFREKLNKLQKIPLPASFILSCDHKILFERCDELISETRYLLSPAMIKLFEDISNYYTAPNFYQLIKAALSNKQIPISYLPNLMSIGYFIRYDHAQLEQLVTAVTTQNFTAFKQTAMTIVTRVAPNKIPVQDFEYFLHGPSRQIRLDLFHPVKRQSPPDEIIDYILKKYYLKNYPDVNVSADQLYRPNYGFDHISRLVLLLQLLIYFLYYPGVSKDPALRSLSQDENFLLRLAILCHAAANKTDNFRDIRDDAIAATIFRTEALLLGFTLDQVEPIAWALENKDNKVLPRGHYQWLIHDAIHLDDLRFVNSLDNHLLDSFKPYAITPEAHIRLNRIIDNYKEIIKRFMASDRLAMQQSKSPFLAVKAFMYQTALEVAANSPSGLTFDTSYLLLGEIDLLLLFDPNRELKLIKHLFNNLHYEIKNTKVDQSPEHTKVYYNLYTLISHHKSVSLHDLANYHRRNLFGFDIPYALANRYLEDQDATLTASPEFKKLWIWAAGQMRLKLYEVVTFALFYKKIPFSYLSNIISIALHLHDGPFFLDYRDAVKKQDLETLKKTGLDLLEQHSKLFFPHRPIDEQIKQLATGAHNQILYPKGFYFQDIFLNCDSSIEEIASYILHKYYLISYPNAQATPLYRPLHGFDHVSRAFFIYQLILRLLQEYAPEVLCNTDGTPLTQRQLRLLGMAVLCHDAANTGERFKDEAAQAAIFKREAMLLGFDEKEVEPIAHALEHKDNKKDARNIFQWLIHDPDCLEFMRVIPNNLDAFRPSELDIFNVLTKHEASSKLNRIIANYKKIITLFMATDRRLLQNSKDSFLATKALLYQIAIDLAHNPSSTHVHKLDMAFLELGDIDPLMLFDPDVKLLKYAENKAYQLLLTADKDDPKNNDYWIIFTIIYKLISYRVSELCGDLAGYHEEGYVLESLHRLATRYLEDDTASITALPSIKKLWLYSVVKMDEQAYSFVTLLLCNEKIPFSYLSNAISIALNLYDRPFSPPSRYLGEYIEAAAKEDLSNFIACIVRILEQDNVLSKNAELKQLALGQHQQIKYPQLAFGDKIINSQSSIEDIAPYILHKYYLKYYPMQPAPLPPLYRQQRGFDHVVRCIVLFRALIKLLEEESPKLLENPDGKLLGEKEKTLLQLALLCHEAANLTDLQNDNKANADIFRLEAEQLGFLPAEFEPIASALANKDVKVPSRNIYQALIHDPDYLEELRLTTNNSSSFRKEELDLYNFFVATNNHKAITKLTNIVEKYKQFVINFMASNRLPLQQHSSPFIATQAFLYQLAIHHSIPSAGNKIIFDPNTISLLNIEPLRLFDEGPEFLRMVSEKLSLCTNQEEEPAEKIFQTEGLYLRALVPVTTSSRTHVEELSLHKNKVIITRSKVSENPHLLWQAYLQNKLPEIRFRPATYIKQGLPIMPYQGNNYVSFLIRKDNKAVKFYKSNIFSNDLAKAANGTFNFQRTDDHIKAIDSVEDLERKVTEQNDRRLGKRVDPYNRHYGSTTTERNEVFLINYDYKNVLGIHIGNPENKNNLLEALYWYVRLAIANQKLPFLYYYCPIAGILVSISRKELLEKYFNNVNIPSIVTHKQTHFGDIQLQNPNYQAITADEIMKAKITMEKVLGREIYTATLESKKKFTATLHSRDYPIITIDNEAKPTFDSRGLLRQMIRVYQEQIGQACQKLLSSFNNDLKDRYGIMNIEIKIGQLRIKYSNVTSEKTYLYCYVNFLDNDQNNNEQFYYNSLQKLLGFNFDKKTVEIDLEKRKMLLLERTPHKILEVLKKLQCEFKVSDTEKEVPSITTVSPSV